MNRRHQTVTLLQATQGSPTFARLTELTRDSVARLKAIEPLIPRSLRGTVQAGPIEGPVWCLILENNASAAKFRQLLPALASHLRVKGWEVNSIRLKVQIKKTAD
jgi:hypothetical protein